MIKLIEGPLLSHVPFDDVYNCESDDDKASSGEPSAAHGAEVDCQPRVLSLADTARLMHREAGTVMDEDQYILYESICAQFLLSVLNDGLNALGGELGHRSTISEALQLDVGDINRLKDRLRQLGAKTIQLGASSRDQLIAFVTGMAGAGKSTGLMVAQRFCFEFYKAASIAWGDNTFLFTAYTGAAASAFDGITTLKGLLVKVKDRNIKDSDRDRFKQVRIIIIDEISFMKDSELTETDRRLKDLGDRDAVFGGFNVIFCGDFRQLPPVGAKSDQLLYHPLSSRLLESNLNCVIILKGMHRFKDDIRYGELLRRLMRDELTDADFRLLNTRVIGRNGLKVPDQFDGDGCYAASRNKTRSGISAALVDKHLQNNHPDFDDNSDASPPKHTLILKADVNPSSKSTVSASSLASLRKRIVELGESDVRVSGEPKLVPPTLVIHPTARFMCTSNDNLEEHGTGNGTQVGARCSTCFPESPLTR